MQLIQDRLVQLMQKNKLSYQDLADITSIHKSTLQRYFTGRSKKIPIERIWPIAFALGTTPNYLMGDTDDPSPAMSGTTSYAITSKENILNDPTFTPEQPLWIKTQKRITDDAQYKNLLEKTIELDSGQIKSTLAFVTMITAEEK